MSWRNLSEMDLQFARSRRRATTRRKLPPKRRPAAWRSVRAVALALVHDFAEARLAFMLADSGVTVLLTQEGMRDVLPAYDFRTVIRIDTQWPEITLDDGTKIPPHGEVDTFVTVKRNGEWRISVQTIHNQFVTRMGDHPEFRGPVPPVHN